MHCKLVVLVLVLSLQAISQPSPATPMTHEEEVIRTAYGKLSFAAQIGMLWHATEQHSGWPRLNDGLVLTKAMNDQIHFDISGLKVGKLADIRNQSWTSLVEGPVDVLFLTAIQSPVGFAKGKVRKEFK